MEIIVEYGEYGFLESGFRDVLSAVRSLCVLTDDDKHVSVPVSGILELIQDRLEEMEETLEGCLARAKRCDSSQVPRDVTRKDESGATKERR